ncbi:MAG TPA: Holliday junction branch migration protein RuvA [Clostridiales bacterium]|nr:Holliday junction branch migration protein RuvA [Clostridiales bacterium]
MYAYIVGKVDSFGDGFLVVEAAGVGYFINASNYTVAKFGRAGETVKVYTYLSVREDDMSLYGFYSQEEKRMFLRLIGVSGVGPKMAIGILSAADVSTLATSIVSGDIKSLSKVKGIGKKTAERIVVELKENIGEDSLGFFSMDTPSGGRESDSMSEEALEVLTTLGVSRTEAFSLVAAARKDAKNVNELVMAVLQRLDK